MDERNKYIDTYVNNYIKTFRNYVDSEITVNICGLADFITAYDYDISLLTTSLSQQGIDIYISNGPDTIDEIVVEYNFSGSEAFCRFEYVIENLISVIELSSRTGISVVGILVMQIISRIICKSKIMYKALVLDLDDTLWRGTLAEEGIDAIRERIHSQENAPFLMFMNFVRTLTKELGVYVAICSRNDLNLVKAALDALEETEFPLKNQIDCIVANFNDKSKNIEHIAQTLSILPNAVVFIDDSPVVRDEVRHNLPYVFVPEWSNHTELITMLIMCCVFDRSELSLRSKCRKRLLAVLRLERERCYLPQLYIRDSVDTEHVEALHLYAKSNQFRFATNKKEEYINCKSLKFEIYRENGENLGICSVLTYKEVADEVHILNWAISCRYFEIGLEEYILLYITQIAQGRQVVFSFDNTEYNGRVIALINKYSSTLILHSEKRKVVFNQSYQLLQEIQLCTNLKEYANG